MRRAVRDIKDGWVKIRMGNMKEADEEVKKANVDKFLDEDLPQVSRGRTHRHRVAWLRTPCCVVAHTVLRRCGLGHVTRCSHGVCSRSRSVCAFFGSVIMLATIFFHHHDTPSHHHHCRDTHRDVHRGTTPVLPSRFFNVCPPSSAVVH